VHFDARQLIFSSASRKQNLGHGEMCMGIKLPVAEMRECKLTRVHDNYRLHTTYHISVKKTFNVTQSINQQSDKHATIY